MSRATFALFIALAALGGCVTTGKYDAKVAELARVQRDTAADRERLLQHVRALERQIAALEERAGIAEERLKAAVATREQARRELDDAVALIGALEGRLAKLGQDVAKLTGARGELSAALEASRARLDELRRYAAAAETRAELFRGLVQRFQSMIDARKLDVVYRRGRMLIVLPVDVLFDSGRTAVKPEAQAMLTEVAGVLAAIPDRKFLVVGHTDDVPIHTRRFPSNWELSTGRAIAVAQLLMSGGMPTASLGVAGHGEHDPVAPNDTDENRSLNRRIEIALEPNLSELPPAVAAARN